MGLPRIKMPDGGMLDGIKSKLGFSDAGQGYDAGYRNRDRSRDAYDDYDDADYPDYGEYGDYGDYADDADADAAPGSNYDPYSSVTTRPARSAHARTTGFTSPRLVSIDDVRAHTQVPESLNRDPLPPRRVSSSLRGERTVVESAHTAHANTPSARAAAAAGRERSEGLNSLFSSTDAPAASPAPEAPAFVTPAAKVAAAQPAPAPAPKAAPAAPAQPKPAVQGAIRSLVVVKPASYAEVEKVSKALKAGNVVVLALKNTPDSLAKRILDFAFGAASVLDANVDRVDGGVFVIARGAALLDSERESLRNQGVL